MRKYGSSDLNSKTEPEVNESLFFQNPFSCQNLLKFSVLHDLPLTPLRGTFQLKLA
jgi:hypothetical protein